MKNFWGQEITIGSLVGVGFRRTGAKWHQLGVVVNIQKKPLGWDVAKEKWVASVVWVSEDRGQKSWYDGPNFRSAWEVQDLLAIDETTIDAGLLDKLNEAYADVMMDREPSGFIPDA